MKYLSIFFFIIYFSNNAFAQKKHIDFEIGILQPFSTEDTQDSHLYKTGFEATLFYHLGLYAGKLSQCGYIPKYQFQYYPHEDTPKMKTLAKKLENKDVWFILGPNKSDQFLNSATVIKETMMISGMANAEAVINSSWPYFTMYPSNKKLAAVTHYWVKNNEEYAGEYGIITDPSCIFCKDFMENYIHYAGKPAFIYESSEDLFQPQKLQQYLSHIKVTSLLLPIYSSFSGKVISSLNNTSYSGIKFIGNDGLGDELNHVSYYPIDKNQKGFSIRLGPVKSETLKTLKMENLLLSWNDVKLYPPDEAIYFKETLDKITNILCKNKPTSKEEFNKITQKLPKTFFQSEIGFGVFELKGKKFFFKKLLRFNQSYEN